MTDHTTPPQQEILPKETRLVELNAVELGLAKLREDLKGVQFDVTTKDGEKAARDARNRCVSIRTGAKKAYETWNAPMLAKQRGMRDEVARINAEVEAIEKPIDEQIKAQEAKIEAERAAKREAERVRFQAIQDALQEIRNIPALMVGKRSEQINKVRDSLADRVMTPEQFGDSVPDALALQQWAIDSLATLCTAAKEQEDAIARIAEQTAALEQQRKEQEARDEAARVAAAAEQQRIAAEQAEQQRLLDERQAAMAKQEADARAAREAAEATARAEREAAQKKLDDERAAFEAQKQAEEQRQRDAAAAAQKLIDDAAAEAARKAQAEEDERARVALMEAKAREEAEAAERAKREANETAIRNKAPDMLDVLRQWSAAEQSGDAEELANASQARDEILAFLEDGQ